jgi:hypothetical protein
MSNVRKIEATTGQHRLVKVNMKVFASLWIIRRHHQIAGTP